MVFHSDPVKKKKKYVVCEIINVTETKKSPELDPTDNLSAEQRTCVHLEVDKNKRVKFLFLFRHLYFVTDTANFQGQIHSTYETNKTPEIRNLPQ